MSGDTATILIAEDDRAAREALERALRFEGYAVLAARDGGEALEYLTSDTPDVVLLDVMMPGIDGLTVCRRLRERGMDLPVLMLTARHEISDRVAGLDAGADDYLPKPFALDELLARLRALLRRNAEQATTTGPSAEESASVSATRSSQGQRSSSSRATPA